MGASTQVAPAQPSQKKWMKWTGRGLSLVPVLFMSMGFVSAFLQPKAMLDGMAHFGYTADRLPIVFTLEAIAVVLFLIPQTAIFGAVFMTAYFGGAVATHVRIHDPGWPLAVIGGICAWIGLYLREERLRELVPFRRRR
ncbi:MAG: DoxX family protein [Acidobacteria bacterium]|nr:DoxX family protein [Acidobacteriota bacterium]MBV9144869.1 DoxX family protein [Acidobacteriota bacterium]